MRIAVLGAGTVGRTLAPAFAATHHVTLGTRSPDSGDHDAWSREHGVPVSGYRDAILDAELVVNATPGVVSAQVLKPLADELTGLVLLDVANPLDFSDGFPPTVVHERDLSLGERLQAVLPHTSVVKALNTMTAALMVAPGAVAGPHTLFLCGDDDHAKRLVAALLGEWGWQPDQMLDLGDITAARATEMYLLLWLRIMAAQQSPMFNVAVLAADKE